MLLEPRAALAMGMVVHELATNAHKFGALSAPNGQVAVSWRLEDISGSCFLVWSWRERGGPPVLPPTTRGFGANLIERTVRHDLNGTAVFSYEIEGLIVSLTFPVAPVTPLSAAGTPAAPT